MASANQTVVDTVGPTITDTSGNTWAITSGGQVAINGVTNTGFAAVTELAIVNGVMWSTGNGGWYSTTNTGGYLSGPVSSPLVASLSNTTVTTVGPTIVDASGNSWTITSGGQVGLDSVAVANTSSVVELAYVNGVLWQKNSSNTWYSVTSVTLPSTVTWSAATTTSPIAALTLVTPGQQISNAAFTVTGSISGYSAAPTLYYRDDAGAWGPLPSGAIVTATSYSFTNPALPTGTHTVSVEDSNNTSIAVTSGSFSVVSAQQPVITVTSPSLPVTGTSFTMSGALANYAVPPTLTFSDNASTPASLPAATVTTTSFTFTHPGLSAGPYTTVVSDGTDTGEVSYSVTSVAGGASLNLSTAPPATSLTDNSNNRWSISAAGNVVVNGTVDTTSANASELAWVSGRMWYKNASGLWFGKTTPSAAWSPTAGTTTSPLSNLPSLTINAIASPQPNTAFQVTGSLANYSTAPTLTYSDNGAAAIALPSGSTVTTTSFSFLHPGMASGQNALTVSDGTYSSPAISYSVFTTGFISLPATAALSETITGLLPSTLYNVQVYATNAAGQGPDSALISATTSAPSGVLPSAPTGLTSTSVTQTTVTLSWVEPTTGSTPLAYATQWSPHAANTWTAGPTGSTTTAQITGLTAGDSYDFEVSASNTAGIGPWSATYTVSTLSSSASAVTWSSAASFGTLTLSNSNLTVTTGGSTTPGAQHACILSSTAVSSGSVSFEVTLSNVTANCAIGLVNSSFQLTNNLGSDANSTGFYMSTGTHPAQTIWYNGAASLAQPSGNAPSADTNGAVFTFCVNFTTGVWWVTGPAMQAAYGSTVWNDSTTASPATGIGGIPLGVSGALSIAFSAGEGGAVAVLNPGSSSFSRAGSIPSTFPAWNGTAVTVVIPGRVTNFAAGTPTSSSVTLTWGAPVTGSLPFTYYVMQSPHGTGTYTNIGTTTATSFTVTGLSANTSYDFEVYAANSAGDGPPFVIATPGPASAVGYNLLTFGPDVIVGSTADPTTSFPEFINGANWVPYTFTGTSWTDIGFTQNTDGSVTLDGTGESFGNGLSTAAAGDASLTTNRLSFTGQSFGGGAYFEATAKISGPASFWANDIETMNGVSVNAGPNPWPGQSAGYGDWIETDIMEFDTTGVYGFALHNWYNTVGFGGPGIAISTLESGSPASPSGAVYTNYNRYGMLWVPATSTSPGYVKWFFNGSQVGNTIRWNQYNSSAAPPPVDLNAASPGSSTYNATGVTSSTNSTAYAVLDTLHLALILGAGPGSTNQISSVTVWQASGSSNLPATSGSLTSGAITVTTIPAVTVPGAPVGLSAGAPTTTSVPLTWSPPTTGSAPTGYQVQYKLTTSSTWINVSPTVPA